MAGAQFRRPERGRTDRDADRAKPNFAMYERCTTRRYPFQATVSVRRRGSCFMDAEVESRLMLLAERSVKSYGGTARRHPCSAVRNPQSARPSTQSRRPDPIVQNIINDAKEYKHIRPSPRPARSKRPLKRRPSLRICLCITQGPHSAPTTLSVPDTPL